MNKRIDNFWWRLFNSLWVIWPIFFFVTGIQLVYVGKKVDKRKWRVLGWISFVATWIIVIFSETDLAYGIVGLIWILNIIYDFIIRKEYLFRLSIIKENIDKNGNEKEKAIYENLKKEYNSSYSNKNEESDVSTKIEELNRIEDINAPKKLDDVIDVSKTDKAEENKDANSEKNINNVVNEIERIKEDNITEKKEEENKKIKIDINTCDEKTLMDTCNINIVIAKRAIKYRKEKDGFKSIDEFIELANIPMYRIDDVKEKIICGLVANTVENKKVRRKVDF